MSARKPIIAGNWKLNKTIRESLEFVTLLKRSITSCDHVDVVVCPVYTALSSISELLIESDIKMGAQDVYWEEKGAFTGEVSAALLKDAGATYVIIGHSERRQFFHESNETVNKKTKAVINVGLTTIVCVGEMLAERESGKTFQVIEEQLTGSLANFNKEEISKIVIAYEPVWAIGTGKVATPAQAQEVHEFIRSKVATMFGEEIAAGVRIQYGGSVKPDNIGELMRQNDIDGALVGGASLEVASFVDIVKNAAVVAVK